jgi:hypothetical protein
VIRWLRALFLGRAPVPGRTRDSVKVNRKFNMPDPWMSRSHFAMWIEFLHDRCRAGDITRKKLWQKIRAASRSYRAQIARNSGLPEDGRPETQEDRRELARRILAKAAHV